MITPFPAGGLFNRSTMNAKLEEIGGAITEANWQLIEVLDNTGPMSGTWTAPDFFGDGSAYDLGVYEIGGGASGGAKTYNSGEIYVTGGASGYGKNFIINNVAPNTQYSYVVGAKGEGVTASRNTTGTNGNSGGTTSFNLVEAEGGQGGFGYSRGASGGQASDVCNGVVDLPYTPRRLFGCVASFDGGGATQPVRDGQNMFDENMITLCAGGWAFNSSTARLQEIVAMPDGTKGGDGSSSATGNNATGYGNGGGGVARWSSSGTATSGSGSDGAIFLYARRSQEVTA